MLAERIQSQQLSQQAVEAAESGGEQLGLSEARLQHQRASSAVEACLITRSQLISSLASARQAGQSDGRLRGAHIREDSTASEGRGRGGESLVGTGVRAPLIKAAVASTVDLVLHLAASLKATGIRVASDSEVVSSPSGMFDRGFSVHSVNGRPWSEEEEEGPCTVVMRCENTDILSSLATVPARHLQGKSLRLLQAVVHPDAKGFGIDLTPYNRVARVVQGGAASKSDLASGDIIVGVDSTYVGSKRLVDVMEKGKASYLLMLLRPETLPIKFTRLEPTGTGVTVAWEVLGAEYTHFQLEWKRLDKLEWTHTVASSALTASLVTKGNLTPTAGYQFRVRGGGPDGEWGPFSMPSPPIYPDGKQRRGEPTENTQGELAEADEVNGGVSRETIDGVLAEQREAIKAKHEEEFAGVEADLIAQLRSAQNEADEWKEKFLGLSGTAMQALMEARSEAYKQVEKEIASEGAAVEEAKRKAALAEEAANEADSNTQRLQREAENATREAEVYGLRMGDAIREAREEVEKATADKMEFVLRNAAMELRDQRKKLASQHAAATQRKVAETLKVAEAKAAAHLRSSLHALETSQAHKLATLRSLAGAEAERRILDVQHGSEEMVSDAVKAAVADAEKAAVVAEASAVERARLEAAREVEGRFLVQKAQLEQQLLRATEQLHAKEAENEQNKEMAAQQIVEIRRRASDEAREAARLARLTEHERVAAQRKQMEEAIAVKSRDAVAKREYQMVREFLEAQRAEAAAAVSTTVTTAAAGELSEEGDELSELPLKAPSRDVAAPTQLPHVDELMEDKGSVVASDFSLAHPEGQTYSLTWPDRRGGEGRTLSNGKSYKLASSEKAEKEVGGSPNAKMHARPSPKAEEREKRPTSKGQSYSASPEWEEEEEGVWAPSSAELRLREWHTAERKAMVARQHADEMLWKGSSDELSLRHAEEREKLRGRQLDEAIARGASLAYQEELRRGTALLTHLLGAEEPSLSADLASHCPVLQGALSRVQQMAEELKSLGDPQDELEAALERERRAHARTTKKLADLLHKRQKEEGGQESGSNEESESQLQQVRGGLQLLQLQAKSSLAMEALLNELAPDAAGSEMEAACDEISRQLSASEVVRSECTRGLRAVLDKQRLGADDLPVLRQLLKELSSEQESCRAREAQLRAIHAEAARTRLRRLHEARARFEEMSEAAKAGGNLNLELPCAPIAAARDETSIALDWLPPRSPSCSLYQLQWRELGSEEWLSTEGSSRLSVPCCAKAGLRAHTRYEFRVRAGEGGVWGAWSHPSEAVSTHSTLHLAPSRPLPRRVGKARLEARWGCSLSAVESFELQWRKVDASWRGASSVLTQSSNYTTSSLHPGSIYVFRVRACVVTYSGESWTPYSPTSPPIRPVADALAHAIQEQPLLSEVTSSPVFARVDVADQIHPAPVVSSRRRAGEEVSVVSSTAPTEAAAEAAAMAAAAAAASRYAAVGDREQSKQIRGEAEAIQAAHQRQKTRLRELRTRCVNTNELNGEDELNHLLELQHVQIKESNGGTRR